MAWILGGVVFLAVFFYGMYHFAGFMFTKLYSQPQEAIDEILDTDGQIPAAWVFRSMKRQQFWARIHPVLGTLSLRRARRRTLRRAASLIHMVKNASHITDETDRRLQVSALSAARQDWQQRDLVHFFDEN